MSWWDDLLGSLVARLGTPVSPQRKTINFSADFVVADNPTTEQTDVSLAGGLGGGVSPSRQILTAGLATGGGDLSADRTIRVQAGLNTDIAPLGATALAGASGKAADAAHVHPYSDRIVGPNGDVAVEAGSATAEVGTVPSLAFFGGTLSPIRRLVGSTLKDKLDNLIAILGAATGYALIQDDSYVPGDNADYQGPFTTSGAGAQVLQSVPIPDEGVTRLVFAVFARNTGTAFYKYKYAQDFTRASGGGAVMLDGGETPITKDNISGGIGAFIFINGNNVELKISGSVSTDTRGYFKVWKDPIGIVAAT